MEAAPGGPMAVSPRGPMAAVPEVRRRRRQEEEPEGGYQEDIQVGKELGNQGVLCTIVLD